RQSHLRGIAQFFTFGQLLGEDTMLEAVRLLPAAGWLTYDLGADTVDVERYWRLEGRGGAARSRAETLDRVADCFDRAVRRCTDATPHLGLSLSGGMDSRTILAAIGPGSPITTVCMGMAGSRDHASATELARLSHRPHHQCLLAG